MSSILDRIASVTLKAGTIEIPEWGVEIGVREMTARERVEFGANAKNIPHAAAVRLIIDCATDPATGSKLFEKAHQDMLLGKSGDVIDRIATKICELSGLTDKAAEDLEKNS
ncbi:hypothetical protein [Pseudomonas sp.]|uniref:hypothetical protein n=1 Tax=Pseudomonas sp. TaxID=306 RepID=UPI003341C733